MTTHNLITPPPPPSLIPKAKRNWIKTKRRVNRKHQALLEAAQAGSRPAGGAGAPDTDTTAATHMQQDNDAMMHEMGEEEDNGEPATHIDGDDMQVHPEEVAAMQERLSQAEKTCEQQRRDLQTTQRLLQEATVLNEAMRKKLDEFQTDCIALQSELAWSNDQLEDIMCEMQHCIRYTFVRACSRCVHEDALCCACATSSSQDCPEMLSCAAGYAPVRQCGDNAAPPLCEGLSLYHLRADGRHPSVRCTVQHQSHPDYCQ
jgi:hypothetical protein